jgi:tRNA threonylcarbamoyladenosine biosynthesis protein TsaE
MGDEPGPFATTVADTEATLALGAQVGRALIDAGLPELVIDLRGELGAGKTVFVRGLARGLGLPVSQRIVSPTFTIARAYALEAGVLRELHHLDAYRLGGAADLEAAGFEAMCGNGCVTCVEWGENVEEALPVDRLCVTLAALPTSSGEPGGEAPRLATLTAGGPRSGSVLARLRAAWVAGRPEGA